MKSNQVSLPGIIIRQMTKVDVPSVAEFQARAAAPMRGWDAKHLAMHVEIFPEGQLIAVDEQGKIVGSSSALIIDWDDYAESADWISITGNGTFQTHNPLGKTLYGADILIAPEARKKGIGSLFYENRKKLVKERKLKRMLTGGRIPGYSQLSKEISPREYVHEVIQGKRKDPTLNFQLKNGFVVLDVISDYLHDTESQGYATLLEWLNPEYSMHLIFEEKKEEALSEMPNVKVKPSSKIRIATLQYLLRPINTFEEFSTQVEFFVKSAKDYKCDFIIFPELFTTQLLSYLREPAPARAIRQLAQLTPDYEKLFKRLAEESQLYIIAGTHPVIEHGELFNAAHLFTPKGRIFRQKKVHLTPMEKNIYQMSRGHGFYVYHTDYCKIAILICYDVEFPEAARILAEAGAEILFIPSSTDERQAFLRVRYCAQARAIENQIYVVMSGAVGNLPNVPGMATNYSQASILTPSDYNFSRDGIAAEGNFNQEQIIIADIDLNLLIDQRLNGTVIPLNDLIKDAYDHVFHYSDLQPSEKTLPSAPISNKNEQINPLGHFG